jgi:outer membrane immunogenic protein
MRVFIPAILLAMLPVAAGAADLAPVAAPAQAVFSWSGFYVGANGGYGTAQGNSILTAPGFVGTSTGDTGKGGLAGGQIGANWQTGILVLGVEADYQWADISRTAAFGCGLGCVVSEKVGMTGFGTVRGRVGAAFDRVLLYATAGGAWLGAQDEATVTLGALTGQLDKISLSGAGWTAGGGLEVALDRNWSGKGEYLYLATSRLSGSGAVVLVGPVRIDVDAHAHIGRVGVNYRF